MNSLRIVVNLKMVTRKACWGYVTCLLLVVIVINSMRVVIPQDYFKHFKSAKRWGISEDDPLLQQMTDILVQRLHQPSDSFDDVVLGSCLNITIAPACIDKTCSRPLSLDPGSRVKDILSSPKLKLSVAQRDLILSIGKTIPESDVIIVSASSSNHYDEMQAMFESLHKVVYPHLSNFTMVLFDIGLTGEQINMTKKNCRCHVVRFPVELFPAHMKENYCYSWKPIIVLATVARARKYLVWQDASVRWGDKFKVIFDRADRLGHQMLRYNDSHRIPANTLKQTFDYMNEEVCAYLPYPELQANCMLHKHDPLVIQLVLEPWARCALERDCMCPVTPPGQVLWCSKGFLHRCHRFDQSAISILMAKLYGKDLYRFLSLERSFYRPTYTFVMRENKRPDYFKT